LGSSLMCNVGHALPLTFAHFVFSVVRAPSEPLAS
jgi:hypothetical protein